MAAPAPGYSRFPSGAQYVDALQNTGLCFRDTGLRGGQPSLDRLGRPRPISGNFASVFSITTGAGSRFAVKCFTRDVADQEERYLAISEHLARTPGSWRVGFDYLPDGILVEGRWYPVLKMEWVDGAGLIEWIGRHLHDRAALATLDIRFTALVAELAAGGVAHGNLLVTGDGSLRLVDYDGMYVPGLTGLPPSETGHRNYQSPLRGDLDFGPELDRFSTWLIHLSLRAIATDPELWTQLHPQGAEFLLLAEEDLRHPDGSARFRALRRHPAVGIRELADQVGALAAVPLDAIPALTATGGKAHRRAGTGRLPEWMADHLQTTPPANPRPLLLAVFTAVTLLLAATIVAVVLVPAAFVLPLAAATGTWMAGTVLPYRRRPECRAVRDAKRQVARCRRGEETAGRAAERLERQLTEVKMDARALQIQFSVNLARLADQRRKALARALRRRQEEHLRARLARHRIAAVQLPGVDTALVTQLVAAGIETAGDFTRVVFDGRTAIFQHVDGRRVRLRKIDVEAARRLSRWRDDRANVVKATEPLRLTDRERQEVTEPFDREESKLRQDRQLAIAAAAERRVALGTRLAAERAKMTDAAADGVVAAAELARRQRPSYRQFLLSAFTRPRPAP